MTQLKTKVNLIVLFPRVPLHSRKWLLCVCIEFLVVPGQACLSIEPFLVFLLQAQEGVGFVLALGG